MNLKYEIVGVLFKSKKVEESNNELIVFSDKISEKIASSIQYKIESYIKSTTNDVLLENLNCAIDTFKWARIHMSSKSFEIKFNGNEVDTNNPISISLTIDSNGNISNYDVEGV